MGEDEAIDILQNCIADCVIGEYCEKCGDRLVCEDRNEDCYFQQAIDTILDLYQKEKEKNKILEELLQGRLFELYNYYKDLAGSYQANCIGKDKIKEKIEELEDLNSKFSQRVIKAKEPYLTEMVQNILKDLLEEENIEGNHISKIN